METEANTLRIDRLIGLGQFALTPPDLKCGAIVAGSANLRTQSAVLSGDGEGVDRKVAHLCMYAQGEAL